MWKDSETELDFLDYDYLIQAMMSIINNDTLHALEYTVIGAVESRV